MSFFESVWQVMFISEISWHQALCLVSLFHFDLLLYTNNRLDYFMRPNKMLQRQTRDFLYRSNHSFLQYRLYAFCRGWLPSHCFGSLLLALPIGATFANFQCLPTFYHSREREFFLQVIMIMIDWFRLYMYRIYQGFILPLDKSSKMIVFLCHFQPLLL